jgi:hypothetical protein
MSDQENVRRGWLKFMYGYTAVGAGMMGAALLIAPDAVTGIFGWPEQDPIVLGTMASIWTGFGLVSILGLREPLKFVPILCLQLCYKTLWMLLVAIPLALSGALPSHAIVFIAIFASYVIGDLIAIPFHHVLRSETRES